ncbi:tetratricopeptide repeat protein [Pedobacter frigoris]|uniref:NB-ARC domain-containing protein n=1 Tax=Pedobacter frigoris TaxID=2571272 RepID=A0A4U1CFG8_9SPHI|nr:tetratricopeptide repeat protein [Pedobacter frigoris]TKC04353.1 hypothetical protein FA047_17365 [Pedobacter frigoris]
MDKEIFKIINVDRDAIAVNRGFYYQYLCLLKKWINNFIADNCTELYSEVGDDIKEVGDGLVFTQLKCYSSSFNLKSPEVKKAIFNFFVLYLNEKELMPEIRFVFETNSSIAPKEKLLKIWVENQQYVDEELFTLIIDKISEIILSELKRLRDGKLQSPKMSVEKRETIKRAFEKFGNEIKKNGVGDFVNRISWQFGNQSPESAILSTVHEIKFLLKDKKFSNKSEDLLIDVLLSEIYRCSQEKDQSSRKLDNVKLSAILSKNDQELESHINKKLIDLLGGKFIAMQHAIEELQKSQTLLTRQIESIQNNVDVKTSKGALPKYITPVPPIYPDQIFGRENDVGLVKSMISKQKHLSISGVGGMGKTTLAKAYVNQEAENYDHIIWVNVQSNLISSFVNNNSFELHFPAGQNGKELAINRFDRILSHLNDAKGKNLIVINDFNDDLKHLSKIKSLTNWEVLVTSRMLLTGISSLKIAGLGFEAAKHLYRKYEPSRIATDETFLVFFERIGYNTLIIELVAKTINNSFELDLLGFIDYINSQALDDYDLQIDIEDDVQEQTSRLFAVLQQTFSIANLSDVDQSHLVFFAILPSEGAKISELIEWYGKDHEKQNKVQFPNLINKLQKIGWIDRDGDDVFMHKMLQETIIYEARKELSPFMGQCLQMVWLSRRLNEGISNDPAKAMRFLKYGESILEAIKEPYRTSVYQPLLIIENEVLNVYNWLIVKQDMTARWKDLMKRAEGYLGPDYDDLLGTIYNNYALSLSVNHQNEEAISFYKKGIVILRKYGEKTVANLLYALNNLARAYSEMEQFEHFKTTFEQAMEIRERYKLFNDQTFAIQCNLMGVANQNVGNFTAAIDFFKMAIKAQYQIPVDKRNDLNLVIFFNNLAYNLMLIGENDMAMGFVNKSLAELEKLELSNNIIFPEIIRTLILILEQLGEHDKVTQMKDTLKDILT